MHNFTKRETNLLKILGSVIVITIAYSFIIEPLFISPKNSRSSSEFSKKNLDELENIHEKYLEILRLKKNIDNSGKNTVSISSLVDKLANSLNIINNKVYLREQEGKIVNKIQKIKTEMKFEGVPIKPLINLLYQMENSQIFINISKVKIYATSTSIDKYDAIIEVENFVKK